MTTLTPAEETMPPKKKPDDTKATSVLLRLTTDQLDLIKLASNKLADDVGLNPSVSAFCVRAAVDRAKIVLGK